MNTPSMKLTQLLQTGYDDEQNLMLMLIAGSGVWI
jgi:hypothetical protein